MSETPFKRLNAVVNELKVGMQALVETLAKKGHSIEAKPTTKLTDDQYEILLFEFKQYKKILAHKINVCIQNRNASLNLANIELIEIPKVIADLTWLEELILCQNKINKIEKLENLNKLSQLDLSKNQINKIEGLENLKNLSKLYLSGNNINKIEGLENLKNLTTLELSENKISKMEGLTNLKKLSELTLSDNQISKIDGLENINNLIRLDFFINKIRRIEGLKNLKNLSELDLGNNNINKIEGLENLINLSQLVLYSNEIHKIEGLENLINLSQLDLSANQINKIEGLENLINIHYLNVYDNPLESNYNLKLNPTISHWDIIKNIIDRESETGRKVLIELPVKILLLGNHSSGKSTLLNYLQNGNLNYKSNSTHILKIEKYPLNLKIPNAIFYDFGGQDYYHGIYRTFLSVGSAYLLLWNNDTNNNKTMQDSNKLLTQNFEIKYWLHLKGYIESDMHNDECDPLLLIETHANKKDRPKVLSFENDVPIQNSFYISLHSSYNPSKNEAALAYLKAEIDSIIESKKIKRTEQKWYVDFYNHILGNNSELFTNVKDLLTIYKPTNKENEDEILTSLKTELKQFHNQGLVLYYPEINDDKVCLNPTTLVKYIHDNILKTETLKTYEGRVPYKVLRNENEYIIALLKKQKVLFEHKHGEKGKEYIVPNFLPLVNKDDPEYDLFVFGLNQPLFVLKFVHFIPIGLINQLICFYGRQPERKKFWRNQLLFTFEKSKILVQLNFELLEIKVVANFIDKKQDEQNKIANYLFYTIMAFYWDIEPIEFNKIEISRTTSILEKRKQSIKRKERIDIEKLASITFGADPYESELDSGSIEGFFNNEKYYPKDLYVSRNNQYFVKYIDLINHDVNETRIQAYGVKEDSTITNKAREIAVKPFEIFTNKKLNAMKKVFISYSKDDLQMIHRFKDALVPLHDEGIIDNPWYCTLLEAGSKWDEEIQHKLAESDIVFFMCSISFIRTKYIREHEIKTAIESGKTIIPIIVNFCEWEGYLGDYTALPYIGKPVKDFKNEDLAWHLVTKGIRRALELDEEKKQELDKQIKQLYERLVEGKLE